jgi:hypothetical protein
MSMLYAPWMELAILQAQRFDHLAWFLYGCLEREHILNLAAFEQWFQPMRHGEGRTSTGCASHVGDLRPTTSIAGPVSASRDSLNPKAVRVRTAFAESR